MRDTTPRKPHTFKMELSDRDYSTLKAIAENMGTSPSGLLKAFVSDLVDGDESGGSDERRLADEWQDRNAFRFKAWDD